MPLILRLTDPGSHGGVVCSSASRSWAEGKLIARIGDTYCCPIHGPNPIATGCVRTWAENRLIAFNGSIASCGAVMIATAIRTEVE